MIQKTGLSKRDMKKLTREVNLAESVMAITPEYLNWSEQSITFSRADHPPSNSSARTCGLGSRSSDRRVQHEQSFHGWRQRAKPPLR